MAELPPELRFDRPDDAERHRRAVSGYMARIRDLYDAIHDRFGDEGLDLIREVSRAYGERIARNDPGCRVTTLLRRSSSATGFR